MTDHHQTARNLEFYETSKWAADEILNHEILTPVVIDPCAGSGVLGRATAGHDCTLFEFDIYPWKADYNLLDFLHDRLPIPDHTLTESTVFMNPPFSKSVEFVKRCLEYNVRKIICFQRLAWTESADRRQFWDVHPPNRKYICGNRASSWLGTLTTAERDAMSGGSTAYGWYVWERGHPPGTLETRIYK